MNSRSSLPVELSSSFYYMVNIEPNLLRIIMLLFTLLKFKNAGFTRLLNVKLLTSIDMLNLIKKVLLRLTSLERLLFLMDLSLLAL